MKISLSASALIALISASTTFAQVSITALNSAYTQNFNSLTTAGSWTNNSTLSGWYARTDNTATISAFGLNTGSTTTAGLYSYGSASASDRALGYATTNSFTGSAGSGQNYLGLQLTNSIGASISSFTLAYTGEQWRKDNTATQSLSVQYKIGATAVNDASGWTTISALTFSSPTITSGASALDGNNSSNRTSISSTLSGLSWTAGSSLWIRWVDLNDSGNDHHLTIDDVSFTAVPEPSSAAALFGIAAIAGVGLRRRRRA